MEQSSGQKIGTFLPLFLYFFILLILLIGDNSLGTLIFSIVGIPVALGISFLFWKYSRMIENKMKESEDITISKEQKLSILKSSLTNDLRDVDAIVNIANKLKATNIERIRHHFLKYRLEFPNDSPFSYLKHATITYKYYNDIKLEGLMIKNFPFSLSLSNKSVKRQMVTNILDIPELNKEFSIFTSLPKLCENVLQESVIRENFLELKDSIKEVAINGLFFTVWVKDIETIEKILQTFRLIYLILDSYTFGIKEIEHITCYLCGQEFIGKEKNCTKCKTPKPRCPVCLLDLKPSEKQRVVQTPCCEVFAHQEHMIIWLEKTQTCPNCGSNLAIWQRELKKRISVKL